jgi:hypothetical protein
LAWFFLSGKNCAKSLFLYKETRERRMDAFAVSITLGLSVERSKVKEIIIPGLYFGLFQALMPTVGYVAGFYFSNNIWIKLSHALRRPWRRAVV